MYKCLLVLIFMLFLSGCTEEIEMTPKIADKMARAHPEYYPELSFEERRFLIKNNIREGCDPLVMGCKHRKQKVEVSYVTPQFHHNYNH